MGIVEGISAAKAAFEVSKTVLDLMRYPKPDAPEIHNRLLELQGLILSAQSALYEAHDENRTLKTQLENNDRINELEKLMVYDQSVWWKRTGNGEELEPHPYCTVCWEKDRRLSHLRPGATRGTYFCQIDTSSYTTSEFDSRPRALHPVGKFRT